MAISKPVFLAILVCSFSSVAYSQGLPGIDTLPCIQKLLPCQPFLKNPSSPPVGCCVPLKQVVAAETHCLCQVFTNQAILQAFNVTKEDALNLAKSCGSNVDASLCGTATAPSGSHSIPDTATPTPAPSNSTESPAASPPSNGGASSTHHVGGSVWLAAAILSFIAWAF